MLPWPTINVIMELDLEQRSQFYSCVELELISFTKKEDFENIKTRTKG
jgi:hypothetical protein